MVAPSDAGAAEELAAGHFEGAGETDDGFEGGEFLAAFDAAGRAAESGGTMVDHGIWHTNARRGIVLMLLPRTRG